MDPLIARIVYTETALESIAKLRDTDKTVDFGSIWQFLNQYRQTNLRNLNIAQEVELELERTRQWIEVEKPKKSHLKKRL